MRSLHICFSVILSLILLCSSYSYAQSASVNDCSAIDVRPDQRPDPIDKPTRVAVGIRVVDITEIQDTTETISIDFIVSSKWTDHRFNDFEGCELSQDEVWTPQIDVENSGRLFSRFKDSVQVHADGHLRQIQRFSGALAFSYDAHRFPFDKQDIVLTLLSEEFSQKELVLVIDEAVTGRNPDTFDIPDWKILDVHAKTAVRHFEVYDTYHSIYALHIPAERRSGYFIWKVILPLMLIVVMSWTVFWINPSQVGPQIGMSATAMLTLIAFQLAMGNLLPRLSYFTVMDRFVTGSTIFVFLALIESITTNYLFIAKKEELALKVDRYCSWLFPTFFLIFVLIIFNT